MTRTRKWQAIYCSILSQVAREVCAYLDGNRAWGTVGPLGLKTGLQNIVQSRADRSYASNCYAMCHYKFYRKAIWIFFNSKTKSVWNIVPRVGTLSYHMKRTILIFKSQHLQLFSRKIIINLLMFEIISKDRWCIKKSTSVNKKQTIYIYIYIIDVQIFSIRFKPQVGIPKFNCNNIFMTDL